MTQRNQTAILPCHKRVCVLSALLLVLLAIPAHADIETSDEQNSEMDEQAVLLKTEHHAEIQSGYRFITPDRQTAAVAPYGRLKSGVTEGFSVSTLGSDLKLMVNGDFLHADDYNTELNFDYAGLVRFHAESMALWHNLFNEPYSGEIGSSTLTIEQRDKGMAYGVRTAITQADTRIKLGKNPFHLNLGYWELKQEGNEQLRFSDYYRTGNSTVISEANRVDRVTREGNIGLDAHFRLFDLSYGFRVREFNNEATDLRNTFFNKAASNILTDPGALIPGSHAHDVTPDSRVTSHTVKLFSDLSGGLVGSASYNLTQRENTGGHGDAVPSERPSDFIQSVAGDLTYTPSKRHSFALKYRHQEFDRTSPTSLFYPYSQPPTPPTGVNTTTSDLLLIRPSVSSAKDIVTLSATFRPGPKVIYRLEYNAELETRSNVRNAQSLVDSPTAIHSDSRQTNTGTATFYWKPVSGMKLNATYSYASCDNPSYGTSFSDRHVGKLLLTYSNSGKWGVTANYLANYERGESTAWTIPVTNLVSPESSVTTSMPRASSNNSINTAFWFNPLERLTISTNYSFNQLNVNQTTLLTNMSQNALAATRYRSSAHVYGVDAAYAALEQLDFTLAFQQVRSTAQFNVPDNATFSTTTAVYSSAGIGDQTKLDSTETSVSARADWRINSTLGCSLDYSFRKYDSGQILYDGSIHSTVVALKARW